MALAAVTFSTGLAFAGWTLLGPLGPDIQQHLRIGDTRLGLLLATPVLMGSTLRVPVGALADRFGGRRILAVLLAVTPFPLILMGMYHHSFAVLIVAALLLGVAGASFAAGVRFVETCFPHRRQGFALGIYGIAVGGTVAAALVAPRLAAGYGLTIPFFVLAAAAALACAMFLAFTSETTVARPTETAKTPLPRLVRAPALAPAALFYAVTFGGFIACFAYLPKLLVSGIGATPTLAATWAAAFAAVSVGARVAGGTISDHRGPRDVLRWSFAAIAVAAVGLAAGNGNGVELLIAFVTLALAFGAAAGATMKLLAQRFNTELGRAAGVVGAAGGFGGFIPPLLLATMASSESGYTLPFLGLSAMAGVCLVIAWRLEPRAAIVRFARPRTEARPCR